jgi:hypothetical protein
LLIAYSTANTSTTYFDNERTRAHGLVAGRAAPARAVSNRETVYVRIVAVVRRLSFPGNLLVARTVVATLVVRVATA